MQQSDVYNKNAHVNARYEDWIKIDYVSIEYVIPRCWINPSAHAVLNAPIYASSHDVLVRPFTIGIHLQPAQKQVAI